MESGRVRNRKDFQLAIGFLAFCLFLLVYLIPREVGALTERVSLLPVLITGFIAFLSLLLLINSLRGEKPADVSDHADESGASPARLFTVIAVMAAYAWLLDITGYLITSCLAMVVLFLIFGIRRWSLIVTITGVTVGILYVVFERLLMAPLPVGTLMETFLE
jgi:hypothetical protein